MGIPGSGKIAKIIEVSSVASTVETIDYAHQEIHEGNSFTAYFTRTTAATNAHRSGIYIKTPNTAKLIHMVVQFSGSTACSYSICEAPTIAANIGTHTDVIYNRYRDSIVASGCFNNATVPAAGYITTLNETQIAADGTWATGTVIRTAPLTVGSGPKPAG